MAELQSRRAVGEGMCGGLHGGIPLRTRLYDVVDLEADQVLFIPLCGKCVNAMETLGRPTEAVDAKDVVVVI